ncbi:CRAL/TRIO domain-containing protein [Histoplasma capsulatum var. duboisii H88]|uniref:CRAL/TRIO domain-containing protein n=1 Tax=Ajellomyces capsulatus (strain H88) TaxID=544711 RepID=A0A8A1LH47_AJEC8|nr:CRAL/TRIO domain-containing protein [Histoplasma capsulatum var. duboisii H88]
MWAAFHRRVSPSSLHFASVRLTEHRAHSGIRGWPSRRDSAPTKHNRSRFPGRYSPSCTRYASSFWTFAVAAAIVFGGLGLRHIYWAPDKSSIVTRILFEDEEAVGTEKDEMSTDPALSGHVGHLTYQEETKLREFWAVLFKIFKISQAESVGVEWADSLLPLQKTQSTTANATDTSSVTSKKKTVTKKRFGFFGRSNETVEEKEEISTTGGQTVPSQFKMADDDDKYGLNKEFLTALASQSPEELRMTFWNAIKQDNPDAFLLRFLRARKWDVQKALVMLISTLRWRSQEWKVDDEIVFKGEAAFHENSKSDDPIKKKEGEDMLHMLRIGEAYCRGKDKLGRPICYTNVRLHRIGAYCQSAIEKNIIFQIETCRLMLDSRIDAAVIVFDMTDFGLANMDYIPVKFIIKCFEANYPESLGAILVHKAPWIFSSFWAIIKAWLDPVVASKVHFTSNYQELENFIAKESIPRGLGGSDDYEYKYIEPKAGENDQMKDTAKAAALKDERVKIVDEFQKTTLDWINISSTADKAEDIKKQRQDIASRLSDFYWKLDPYIRARSVYDRIRDAENAATAVTATKTEASPVKAQEQTIVSEKSVTDTLGPQSHVVETPVVAAAAAN